MSIFDGRINYKPFEYPGVNQFIDAMNATFWVHKEVDFTADVQDFKSNLNDIEREVVRRSLLSISQVEIGVKAFWGNLYRYFPKPEFNNLGSTFAECETRHSEAYSRLLEVLGFNDDFKNLMNIPIFADKLNMIDNALQDRKDDIVAKLLFFTIVIENASLFSQFANILSFTRFKGYLKNTSNIIAWTSVDEDQHRKAGEYIINILDSEGFISDRMKTQLRESVVGYIEYEGRLLNWIYEKGELEFFSKEDMLNFMKFRVDNSLKNIGIEPIFNITNEQYSKMAWFDEEIYSNSLIDFFAARPTDYTKHDKSITGKDLF